MADNKFGDRILKYAEAVGRDHRDNAIIMANKLKEGSAKLAKKADKVKQDYDYNRLKPVFDYDFKVKNFVKTLPSLVRVVEYDKRLENEICKGSVGFISDIKGMPVLHIYQKDIGLLDMPLFYPDKSAEIYYKHPMEPCSFIDLQEYFTCVKQEKVKELESLAQALGAKRVKITLKEEKKDFVSTNAKAKGHGKALVYSGEIQAEKDTKVMNLKTIEIALDTAFEGCEAPREPQLYYFSNDYSIQSLLKMRLEEKNPIKEKTYSINYLSSSEMKDQEALKIDAVLKSLKLNGNATLVSEIQQERRMQLEYYIQF